MNRPKIVVVDKVHPVIFKLLADADMEVIDASDQVDDQAQAHLSSADGLVLRSRWRIDMPFIDKYNRLRVIGRVGAGLEHIDAEYAKSKGVEVLSSPEGNRQAVAEHALAMLLNLFNNIQRSDSQVRQGQWNRKPNEGVELNGKTVGIIGYGNTGRAMAKLMSGFDVIVLAYDKFKRNFEDQQVKEVGMEEIYASADVVSLHIPYNEETHYLVNPSWISNFSKPFYLINTSRGGIVETSALLKGLQSGQLKGACLDVLEYETALLKMPALAELPDEALTLMKREDVVLTPHIAGLTAESYQKLSSIMAEKLIQFFKHA